LSNLMTYMDGKSGAENLIENLLQDQSLLSALASDSVAKMDQSTALQALRVRADLAQQVAAEAAANAASEAGTAFDALRASAPMVPQAPDAAAAALDALRRAAPAPAGSAKAVAVSDDPLADLLADAAPTVDDIEIAVAKTGLGGLIHPLEDDALAALLADAVPSWQDSEPQAGETAFVAAELDSPAFDLPVGGGAADAPGPDPISGLDDFLGTIPPSEAADMAAGADPLDDLMAEFAVPDALSDPLADLDSLLGSELAAPADASPKAQAEPEEDAMSLLEELLGGPAAAAPAPNGAPPARGQPANASGFGTISAPQPSAAALDRPRFRLAIFGDFSGRAARGEMEVGDTLAKRRAIALDVDTVEEVIDGFATTLVLPIGPDGKGIAVKLAGVDDLHPDELVENLELFEALKGLRARLSNPSTAAAALKDMQGWNDSFPLPVAATSGRSAASTVPADKRLTDFQKLIGDTTGRLTQVSPIEEMLGQIVGPHIVPGPNPAAEALKAAVDTAMSSAMRLVLHHPEFQALESQWRTLDLLARRIETDVKLSISLYDVSAEEIAADLAAVDDLAQSGLFRLLNDPLQSEDTVGFSALFGMYGFEETPPHADLLGRLGKIAAHVQAPFFTAMTPGFMDVPIEDRHPLTALAWENLRKLPEAAYLGLAAPRFMLRRPYGKKTEPIDAFAFEEFTQSEGLKGLLWANPVALVAILVAQAWKDGGQKMVLGDVMSLDDIPFHFVTDQHGDQVALPCTERNLTEARTQDVIRRGFMPVVSMRGRDVVRLASFQSVAGTRIAGPWSGPHVIRAAPESSPLDVTMEVKAATPDAEAGFDAGPDDLDALLAGFGALAGPADPESIDAELAALLESL
uniref:type VI secretion system contractile sheath domain-containing protein n=1 Tax=Pseudorhodobacter sp. TaxID=1934400 RepID=UPI0039E26E17